ncbi:MAG: chromosome segregation protein SMC [Alphaproteobacteria bacterium]|nr:chromosome segregation protein SMC [Alphaproteobacteria bacterium]
MLFSKLRVAGFKSFVDGTELAIEPGLTGIVGPNGCGKSNLVEALRWCMGETSPKSMRGGEMEDVIFGGTADRPARNLAEVQLVLKNNDRKAPAQFNEAEEIEIIRRIERSKGSHYRINGREVRARDVQLFFADAATGAHATGLVSQGKVGQIIQSKPADRRALLEEAAGITGLHSRRHEAELRLRAAEQNLARLDDVLVALGQQLEGLKRQARQAQRYRTISESIRRAESILLHLRWQANQVERAAADEKLRAAEVRVGELTAAAAGFATEQANAAVGMPALRQAEAEAAAELQRLMLARNELDAEERRIAEAKRDAEQRLRQIGGDIERETALAADATAALEKFDAERDQLMAERAREPEQHSEIQARLGGLTQAADQVEANLAGLTERIAADEARRAALHRRIAELDGQIGRLQRIADEQAVQRQRLDAETGETEALLRAEAEVADAEAALTGARAEGEAAETARRAVESDADRKRQALAAVDADLAKVAAEMRALDDLLRESGSTELPPVIDAIKVAPGYEAALGAALGDDLNAPIGEGAAAAAPTRWESLMRFDQPLPQLAGIEPLTNFVEAPAALARALSQIGVLPADMDGATVRTALQPGQRLVGRDGAMWRWDGFTVAAGAPSAAAARLRQRNRLTALEAERIAVDARRSAANAERESAQGAAVDALQRERAARAAVDGALTRLNQSRGQQLALAQKAAATQSRREALADAERRLAADRAEAEGHLSTARQAMGELVDPAVAKAEAADLRADLAEKRGAVIACRSERDRLLGEAETRRRRLNAIAIESKSWRGRAEGAQRRIGDLAQRKLAGEDELQRLAQRPAEIEVQRRQLIDLIGAAEAKRRAAADALASAESRLAETDKRLKQAEAALGEGREDRVRAESGVQQVEQARQVLAERIAERLQCAPDVILENAGIGPDETLPETEQVATRLDRLMRERDNMGPVNLRAEQESEELDQQITTMVSEKEDLVQAIARLRQGIGALNREGRERLLASFEQVNKHFQDLFVRLFGGGRAHLELTESDDPLEAGLEIMASPPGKRLQSLSLLSGGEQALTALSLLFAVFLTNPAPICVLDEVDAPLDDANVDRVCSLLESIARETNTRFLIVTHHRMTMSRMDRLYGVTMSERGISQLVSVDLQDAERLKAIA